jgi:hypothetical protein
VQSNLENINALSCDVTKEFIFFFEMSAKHLCRFINSTFDFHGDTCTNLRFLDNLRQVRKQYHCQDGILTLNGLRLISKDALYGIMSDGTQEAQIYLHLPKVNDFFPLRYWIDCDDTKWGAHPKSPIQDIDP